MSLTDHTFVFIKCILYMMHSTCETVSCLPTPVILLYSKSQDSAFVLSSMPSDCWSYLHKSNSGLGRSVPGFGPFHLHDEIVVAMSIEPVNRSLCIILVVIGDESKALGLEGCHILCQEDTFEADHTVQKGPANRLP